MKDYFYSQYISKLKKNTTDAMVEESLRCLGGSPYIYRVDVTNRPESEQIGFINKIISAERLRLYSDTRAPFFVNIVKALDNRFIVILSLCENLIKDEDKNRIIKSLFNCDTISTVTLYGNDKATVDESVRYWSKAFKFFRLNIPIQKRELSDDFYSESFDIPDSLKSSISECINSNKMSFKTILELVIGRLACKGLVADKVLINDIHDGGCLSGVPVYFNGKESDADQYAVVKEQLIQAEYNDTLSDELLKKSININLDTVPMINFYYMHDKKYDYFISHMVDGKVYSLNAINALNVGLTVVFKVTEAELDVSYIYNSNLFRDVNISFVHDNVMEMLEDTLYNDFLENKETDADAAKAENVVNSEGVVLKSKEKDDSDNINDIRRNQLKLSCINQIKFFDGLDDKAKVILAGNSDFIAAGSERHFAMPGEAMDKLYFIINGTVAVLGIDRNNYMCPLYALRAGQVFGIESLLDKNESSVCYSVQDEKILLLQVDAEYMKSFANKHSEIYIKLLDEIRSRLVKLEKLWMTV